MNIFDVIHGRFKSLYTFSLINLSSSSAGKTPDFRQRTSPFLNIIRVGTPRTWYRLATDGFLSTSILMIEAVSPTRCFTSSKIGACVWQGPHQVAKKSTSTGL